MKTVKYKADYATIQFTSKVEVSHVISCPCTFLLSGALGYCEDRRTVGWVDHWSQYVSSLLRVLSKKEALLSKFGPTGVKSGVPHTSHMMLSKLCTSHPLKLCRHVVGVKTREYFESLGLNFLGSTDSVEDGELLYIPFHRAAVRAAGKLPEGSPQPAPPAVPSCVLSYLPLCNTVGCICLGGSPCALKTAFFVLNLSVSSL